MPKPEDDVERQNLGQPVYTRPAPEVFGKFQRGWAPKAAADFPQTFKAALREFLVYVADSEVLAETEREILELTVAKAVVYQDEHGVDSCFKRGLFGLFHNLARKWDRIETVGIRLGVSGGAAVAAEAAADGERDPETLYKTVRDLAVYAIHTMRWLKAEEVRRG